MAQSFLQSKYWEDFQQAVGNKTFRVYSHLLVKQKLLLGKSYLYCPRVGLKINTQDVINKISQLAQKESCVFLRLETLNKINLEGYKLNPINNIQPKRTLILDLKKSEVELLKDMHQKTRYNIRLSAKHNISIIALSNADEFCKLMAATTQRDGFRAHPDDYYKTMLNIFARKSGSYTGQNKIDIKIYAAQYHNKILAAGIFIFYNDTVTYLHGASIHEHKNVMAPYAIHWHVIKLAKSLNFQYYDFYGIDENKWPGVTRFKLGFGGSELIYPKAHDVIFNPYWYLLYKYLKTVKNFFRI